MDDLHLHLTPSLLQFYRSKVQEIQKQQNEKLLSRLKHVEMTSQQRSKLEKLLLEYEDELDQTDQEMVDVRNALVRERRAVIELVEENAQLRALSGDISLHEGDRLSSMKRHYETLLSSIRADHKEQLSRMRYQRHLKTDHLEDLITRCAQLETAVAETTKELIRERDEKQNLQVRVEEMQTSIEQEIRELRKRIQESVNIPSSSSAEVVRLKAENGDLRRTLDELKNRLAVQSSQDQTKIAQLQLELHRHKARDTELLLQENLTFREKIKQIERLALRYAPLQGPDVDYLFSEIEYAKDVIDGHLPPPPKPKQAKPKRRKKRLSH